MLCGWSTCPERRGRRWSAASAYLRPALRRPNLLVRADAHVTALVMEGALGVESGHADARRLVETWLDRLLPPRRS